MFIPESEPTIVVDTLEELCQTRVTTSAVTLALALVERGRLSDIGDPVGLVQSIVEELGSAGLVKYVLRYEWSSIPLEIRVTPEGYVRAGYPIERAQVGSRRANHIPIRRDDWRSLDSTAHGGPIERTSLIEHLERYPEHRAIHPRPWECGPYIATGRETDMTSTEIKERNQRERAERVVEGIRSLRARGIDATWGRLVSELGLSQGSMSNYVKDAEALGLVERLGRDTQSGRVYVVVGESDWIDPAIDAESLRDTILNYLRESEGPQTSQSIDGYLKRGRTRHGSVGVHSLQHQLRSMQKAGLITFDDNRYGQVREIVNIRLAKQPNAILNSKMELVGWRDEPGTIYAEPDAPASPVETPTPGPEELPYSLLDSLRERERALATKQARAQAYADAATALAGVDKEESERLFSTSVMIAESVTFQPLEAEYLRYAKEHE